MHVNIPKPCNENWAEMTPTQQGAFCQKCAIDVVDFSNKSAEEVKKTLLEKSGKHLCGRFRKNQLTELSSDYSIWENQQTKTFQSKFLWACLIAFGMTLFTSCVIAPANAGSPLLSITNHSPKDSTKTEDSSETTVPEELPEIFELGEIEYMPEEHLLGEPIIYPDTNEQVAPDSPTCNIDTTEHKEFDKPMIMGKIAPPDHFQDYLKDTIQTIETPFEDSSTIINHSKTFKTQLFPNPSNGRFKLSLESLENGAYSIRIFNMNGQFIQNVDSGKVRAGERRIIGVNLDAHPDGFYLIEILLNGEKQSLKFEKMGG
jgi:hypothetical protein